MEAQCGAEVRRLHIVYFLSRKGRIEHPHLIRVHHLSRNGVRLRDIKRWLGELRGKDMPESFSWSYKRRYKSGYLWQDLLDDDLITPISDNEYVLKGSEISSTTIKETDFSYSEEKAVQQRSDQSFLQEDSKTLSKEENQSHSSETSIYVSTKSSSEIEEESPTFGSETSTLTDDSGKLDMEKNSSTTKHEKQSENPSSADKTERSSPFYATILSKNKNKKRSKKVTISEKVSTTEAAAASASANDSSKISSSSSEPHLTKSKSCSNGASKNNIFRNLITCGAVETNDSAVVPINKQNSNNNNKPTFLNMCASDVGNVHSAEICKRDRFGGSQRVFGTPNWTQQPCSGRKSFDGVKDSVKSKSGLREQRAPSAAYKPANWPTCSQCGQPFKPEKLHAHMKSCKGMKALSKSAAAISAAAEKGSKRSRESQSRNSVSGHLLTH